MSPEIIKYILPCMSLGIGTGATINFVLNLLLKIKFKISFIVSSSFDTSKKLKDDVLKYYISKKSI